LAIALTAALLSVMSVSAAQAQPTRPNRTQSSPEGAAVLIDALQHAADPSDRARAARALAAVPSAAAAKALSAATADSSSEVRFHAVTVLERRSGPADVEAVARALEDPSGRVRRVAKGIIQRWYKDTFRADELAAFVLSNGANEGRFQVLRIMIGGRGSRHDLVPVLTGVARRDPDPRCRALAASELGQRGASGHAEALESALLDDDLAVRLSAGRALTSIGSHEAFLTLIDMTHHSNSSIAGDAWLALEAALGVKLAYDQELWTAHFNERFQESAETETAVATTGARRGAATTTLGSVSRGGNSTESSGTGDSEVPATEGAVTTESARGVQTEEATDSPRPGNESSTFQWTEVPFDQIFQLGLLALMGVVVLALLHAKRADRRRERLYGEAIRRKNAAALEGAKAVNDLQLMVCVVGAERSQGAVVVQDTVGTVRRFKVGDRLGCLNGGDQSCGFTLAQVGHDKAVLTNRVGEFVTLKS
jgi:hypothetical protein